MTVKLALQYLTAAIVGAVGVRQALLLFRFPRDLPLRVMAAGLLCIAVDSLINIAGSPQRAVAVEFLGRLYPAMAVGLWTVMAFCFAAFFVLVDRHRDHELRLRTVRRLGLLVAVALVVGTALPLIMPDAFVTKVNGAAIHDYRSWQGVLRNALLMGTNLTCWSIGLVKAVRHLRDVGHQWLRWSLALVALGAFGMAMVDLADLVKHVLRAIEDAAFPKRYPLTSAVYLTGLLAGQTALAVGLALPHVGALSNRIRRLRERALQRRYSERVEPLWAALTTAYPYVILETESDSQEMEYTRRIAETADALAHLAPYFPAAGLQADSGRKGVQDPVEAARVIAEALRLRWLGEPEADPPYARLEPDHRGWHDQARWLAKVAAAFVQIRAAERAQLESESLS